MKIILFFLSCLFLSTFLKGQNSNSIIDTNHLRSEFAIAKKEFALYEKQHGRFVQTNNVLMHCLTWGNPKATPFALFNS